MSGKQAQVVWLREGTSVNGKQVVLRLERGAYEGAQPCYVVGPLKDPTRLADSARYTPFLNRAEWLFERFVASVTDPRRLGRGPAARESLAEARKGASAALEAVSSRTSASEGATLPKHPRTDPKIGQARLLSAQEARRGGEASIQGDFSPPGAGKNRMTRASA